MSSKGINRRDFLYVTGLSAAGLFSTMVGLSQFEKALGYFGDPMPTPDPAMGQLGEAQFIPDTEISLTAAQKTVQILPGMSTRVMGYEGKVLSGSSVDVINLPNNYLGPILRAKTGVKVRINFINNLNHDSVLHPHGLRVPQDCDGSPMQAIAPGQTKVYNFQVIDRAGPYWFHPHPMDYTPTQVYYGCAGLFTVWDDAEAAAVPGAESAANDIPVIIQDRSFDANNQLLYQPNMYAGFLGDRILVNGVLDARCALEPRAYRLRLLNGSNARTYKLAWSNGMPLQVIGTDGGLLPAVVSKSYIMLAPGERVDLWADFSALSGKQVTLKSLSFQAGMGMMGGMGMRSRSTSGMGMGMMGGMSNGVPLDILVVNVGNTASANPALGRLPPLEQNYDAGNVANFNSPTPFTISMGMMMSWWINGRQYQMTEVAEDETVQLGQPVAWEFINQSPIPHPMHLHNVQFRVVQRMPSPLASYADVKDGFIDTGLKDTVLVWPGERVKIAMNFEPYTGMYMYHCHILEHENMGMMRNYMITDSGM